MKSWRRSRREVALLVGLTAILLAAPLARAEELTREEYVGRAEPICKANVEANKRIFEGAKQEVKEGELKKASKHFFRAATAFGKTIRQLKAVPKPSADEAKLNKWFGYLEAEEDFIRRIGAALAHEERHKAEAISVKLNRNSTRANNTVLGFGFDYCRIDPSRFG
jgi:hypothetical protein